jgi:hypothetical protein
MQEVARHTEQVLMPYYRERLEKADQLLSEGMYKPIFTNSEYRLILSRCNCADPVQGAGRWKQPLPA